MERALGVLAGTDLPAVLLAKWVKSATYVLAADAGADLVFLAGHHPQVIVGDFDSLQSKNHGVETIHSACQDTTDCDKLLSAAGSLGIQRISLICVEGDLPDHALAILHSAVRSPLFVTLVYRQGLGAIVKPRRGVRASVNPGARVSLLPLADCSGVTLSGVQWPLQDAELSSSGLTSISNQAESSEVLARVGSGSAFLFVQYKEEELPNWNAMNPEEPN